MFKNRAITKDLVILDLVYISYTFNNKRWFKTFEYIEPYYVSASNSRKGATTSKGDIKLTL